MSRHAYAAAQNPGEASCASYVEISQLLQLATLTSCRAVRRQQRGQLASARIRSNARSRPPRPHPPRRARGVRRVQPHAVAEHGVGDADGGGGRRGGGDGVRHGALAPLPGEHDVVRRVDPADGRLGGDVGRRAPRADGGRVPRRGVRVRLRRRRRGGADAAELARAPGDALLPRDGDAEARLRGDVLRRPARLLPGDGRHHRHGGGGGGGGGARRRRIDAEARRHDVGRDGGGAPPRRRARRRRVRRAILSARNSVGAQFSRRAILGAIL